MTINTTNTNTTFNDSAATIPTTGESDMSIYNEHPQNIGEMQVEVQAMVKQNAGYSVASKSKSRIAENAGDTDTTNMRKAMVANDVKMSQGTYGNIDTDRFVGEVNKYITGTMGSSQVTNNAIVNMRVAFGVADSVIRKSTTEYIMSGVASAIAIVHGHGENVEYDFITRGTVVTHITNNIIMAKVEQNIIRAIKINNKDVPVQGSPEKQKELVAKNKIITKARQDAVKYFKKAANNYFPSQRMKGLVEYWNKVTNQNVSVDNGKSIMDSGVTTAQAKNLAKAIYQVLVNYKILIDDTVDKNHWVSINPEVVESWLITEFLNIGNSAKGMIMKTAPSMVTDLVCSLPSITSAKGIEVCSAKYAIRGDTSLSTQAINIFNQTTKYVNQEYLKIAQVAFDAQLPKYHTKKDRESMDKLELQRAITSNKDRANKVRRFNNAMDMASEIKDSPYWALFNKEWRGRYNEAVTGLSSHTGSVAKPFLLIDGTPAVVSVLEDNIGKMLNDIHGKNMEKADINERIAQVQAYMDDIRESVVAIHKGVITGWVENNVESFGIYYAAAMDIVKAWDDPEHKSGIPIATDQNCSAIGFLGAIAKDMSSIRAVNLVGSNVRQDIYEMAASNILNEFPKPKQIQQFIIKHYPDVKKGARDRTATVVYKSRKFIIRKLLKSGIMTYGYGSVDSNVKWDVINMLKANMNENQSAEKLGMDVIGQMVVEERKQLLGETTKVKNVLQFMARRAIGNKSIISRANAAKNKTQYDRIVKGETGQGVMSWTVSDGMVVGNQYNAQGKSHGSSLDGNRMNSKDSVNGIMANLVHSNDSALMTLVAVEMNCPIIPIHDSWAVSSGNFHRLQETVRSVFKEMMLNNTVLRDMVEDNKHLFTDKDLAKIEMDVEHILRNEKEFNMDGMESNQWNWS